MSEPEVTQATQSDEIENEESQDMETPDLEDTATQQRGIDVSHYQGKIDWGKVAKAGIKHVCMKMSEGIGYEDPTFVTNWNGAKNAGIKVNCYHYFRGLDAPPKKQMELIKRRTKAVNFDPAKNILALDVEGTGNEKATPVQMADGLNALLKLIKEDSVLSRSTVMIYTSYGYWDSKVKWDKYNFGVYPLWVAHWGAKSPTLPQPWKKQGKSWTWWQHSEKGRVDGISVPVDLDWVKA